MEIGKGQFDLRGELRKSASMELLDEAALLKQIELCVCTLSQVFLTTFSVAVHSGSSGLAPVAHGLFWLHWPCSRSFNP